MLVVLFAMASCGSPTSRDGKVLFDQACARCHAVDGTGDPMQIAKLGVPDMTDPKWQAKHTDEDVRKTIIDGSKSRKMPAFNDFYNDEQIREITRHVRSLKR
jgi:mono/diheme cytochrome c family protein